MAQKRKSSKSSNKSNVKRVVKATKKYDRKKSVLENADAIGGIVSATATSAKKSKGGSKKFFTALCVILVIAIVAVAIYGYFNGWFDGIFGNKMNSIDATNANYSVDVIKNEQLSIHFLMLGNNYTGDSVYIKAGETDILIDAGSREGSASTIANYVDNYCTDGVLEYVVATHAHQDHIAGFVGLKDAGGIFDHYECKNIIEFSRTDATTDIYSKYVDERNAEVAAGAKCVKAHECIAETNGGKKVYDLTGDGSVTMEILDQKYYTEKTSNENNYSVCLMITQGENNYLFTGDLEGEGEESLVELNPNLPQVQLYKGGHHGSYTAASNALLKKIKPQSVCICCCAGSIEYTQNLDNTFPAQDFIDRVAVYTDAVYVTTVGSVTFNQEKNRYQDTGFEPLNGNIVFACSGGKITMYFTHSEQKLKDTDWFKTNRDCPDSWK